MVDTISMMELATALHQTRLRYVFGLLKASGARRVVDLGSGPGWLLHAMLADAQFVEVVGLEQDAATLMQARTMLAGHLAGDTPRLRLINGSFLEPPPTLEGFDAATMVETIEHVMPGQLSVVEKAVFEQLRPGLLIITTPNQDYNPLYGLAPGAFREADHKFEWGRDRFRRWARGVARRNGYTVRFANIGEVDEELGPPTQAGIFQRQSS